jgi:hypothetical protein
MTTVTNRMTPSTASTPGAVSVPGTAPATATTGATPDAATTGGVSGLDIATLAGPAPMATPVPTPVTGGLNAIGARLTTLPSGPSLFELRPGVQQDAVSLPTILQQLVGSPQVDAFVQGLATEIKQKLGVDVAPAMIAAARANPERVVDMLAFSPNQMRAGFNALHTHHQLTTPAPTSTQPTHSKSRQLPQRFDTADLDTVAITRSAGDLKQLAPGLWRGDVPNASMSDAAAKQNIVLAEIVDRLADNAGRPPKERFVVEHQGGRYTSLPHFIEALMGDGYTVEAKITHRVADFVGLKTRAPDGTIIDVPVAAMVKTGVKDARGREAVLPGVHSEVVFSIRAGTHSSDPKLEGDIKWYQGVPNTGFFPCDTMRKSSWTGTTTAATIPAQDGLKAITLAGILADVIQDVSHKEGLAMAGYGVTGVCNDSVAILQQAMTGQVTGYPLFMRDAVLLKEIDLRLKDSNRTDDSALKTLKAAIAAVPSDDVPNTTSTARALSSIPWPAGQAPFFSTEAAREILTKS